MLWIKTVDCSIFVEKRSPLDCTYDDGGDREMLVLNEQVKQARDTIFVKESTAVRSSDKKKLTVSNVQFLKSLGFVVRK